MKTTEQMLAQKHWLKKPGQLWPSQLTALHSLFPIYAQRFLEVVPDSSLARSNRMAWASDIVGRKLDSFSALRPDEAVRLIDLMKKALGQEVSPARRPDRDQARAYGTAGRRGHSSKEIKMVDVPTLELLDHLLAQLGWTQQRLDAFLHSCRSPVPGGAIQTLPQANRVIWALKNMLRRTEQRALPKEDETSGQHARPSQNLSTSSDQSLFDFAPQREERLSQ